MASDPAWQGRLGIAFITSLFFLSQQTPLAMAGNSLTSLSLSVPESTVTGYGNGKNPVPGTYLLISICWSNLPPHHRELKPIRNFGLDRDFCGRIYWHEEELPKGSLWFSDTSACVWNNHWNSLLCLVVLCSIILPSLSPSKSTRHITALWHLLNSQLL